MTIMFVIKQIFLNVLSFGTSLVVHAPKEGDPGSNLGQGTRYHTPQLKIPHATTKRSRMPQ